MSVAEFLHGASTRGFLLGGIMTYRDLTLNDLFIKFGIDHTVQKLFNSVIPFEISDLLKGDIEESHHFPITNEKGKSEFIVVPILKELIRKNDYIFTIHSGESLDIDKDKGLTGECDFIFTKSTHKLEISAPVFAVVEAKKQDIEFGIRQCAAQLVGIQIFNNRFKNPVNTIYGCVTTADDWKFMKLEKSMITVDSDTYYLNELEAVLGIFQSIVDFYK